MSRSLVLLLVAAVAGGCGEQEAESTSDAAVEAELEPDAAVEPVSAPAPLAKTKGKKKGKKKAEPVVAPENQRSEWLPDIDEVARVYPAHGIALHHMAHVYEGPTKDSRAVGYLRRGARFRASEEVSREKCARGWFEIYGGGYVCSGEGTLVDSQPPGYEDPPHPPALAEPLPYHYAKIMARDLPSFARVPTPQEEVAVRDSLGRSQIVLNAAGVPIVDALPRELSSLIRARLQPGFYVSVDRAMEKDEHNRAFVRTVRGGHLRGEQLIDGKHPLGMGVALGQHYALPLAFVYRGATPALKLDPRTKQLVKAGTDLPMHSAYSLTGTSLVVAGHRYYETREGLYVRDFNVRVIAKVPRPRPIPKNERWIRVDIDRQTLTAYEGETPVFATLVSSGLADHATPLGIYRVHAKHVATTMADDMASDGPYSIEDVPWTMYFLGSYALHAAFWHDKFGNQRSHGCVNLAPRDARWLFFWTLPELPSAWHGVLAGVGQGTSVSLDQGVDYPIEHGG